jgi:hypothetical protein
VGWVGDQLQTPIVAAAVAFVAGGIFTALVDLFGREISAERGERRQRRRELRQLRLADIATTQRWVLAYCEYVRKQWYDEGLQWDPERYVGVRPGLIGDEAVLRRLTTALTQLLKRDPQHPATIEEIVELEAAEEGAHRALGEQTERIIAGLDPNLIPEAVVAELTSEVSLARDWYREMGLAESDRSPATAESDGPAAS